MSDGPTTNCWLADDWSAYEKFDHDDHLQLISYMQHCMTKAQSFHKNFHGPWVLV
jgi:hypothetical protein